MAPDSTTVLAAAGLAVLNRSCWRRNEVDRLPDDAWWAVVESGRRKKIGRRGVERRGLAGITTRLAAADGRAGGID